MLEHEVSEISLGKRWDDADWKAIGEHVSSMQRELSLASMDGDGTRLELLTERFLTSLDARMLAVHNVTRNDSTSDPGTGSPWTTSAQRMKGALILSHHGYVSEPFLTFSMFEPKTKKDRTMCIPTFYDRAMHDLYRMLMEPICEPLYDLRLFSSRTGRSLADAVEEVRRLFSGKDAPKWVVRCDVRSFYDTMSHDWLLDNVPVDRSVLEQFLRADRVWKDDGRHERVTVGVPTGNRLSPVLANLILNGIERSVRYDDDPGNGTVVRWVDDLVITARTEDDAARIMARVKRFVSTRGMSLNGRKSYIARIEDGFEFLRFDFFRHGDTMDIRPTVASLEEFLSGVMKAVRAYGGEDVMVKAVNNRIRGFLTKYRISDLTMVSERLDDRILELIMREVSAHSFLSEDELSLRCLSVDDDGTRRFMTPSGKVLSRISDQPRVPHERVWLTANPYVDTEYFEERLRRQRESKVVSDRDMWSKQRGCCAVCGFPIRHDQRRMVMEDLDGAKGFVHSDCREDTEFTRRKGHFGNRVRRDDDHSDIDNVVTVPDAEDATVLERMSETDCRIDVPACDHPETVPIEDSSDQVESSEQPASTNDTVDECPLDAPASTSSDPIEDIPLDDHPSAGKDSIEPDNRAFLPERLILEPDKMAASTPTGRRSKFDPIVSWLSGCNKSRVDVNIEVLQQLMDGKLCKCALTNRKWWIRTNPASLNDALEQVGWSVIGADIAKGTVAFRHSKRPRVRFDPAEQSYIDRRDPIKGIPMKRERKEWMKRSKYGGITRFLLDCHMDQLVLGFGDIERMIGESLPKRAWKDHKWWCTRVEHGALFAIESGDFSKVSLDMDDHTIIVTRTCCIPDPGRMNVREGSLKIKEHMKP